jgi:uncharacterized protein (TIGR00251 family)
LHEDVRGLIIELHVQPNARKSTTDGEYDGALKLRLAAPPVDGKANAAVLAWAAQAAGVSKSRVDLISGEKSRRKRVLIRCEDDREKARVALLALCSQVSD